MIQLTWNDVLCRLFNRVCCLICSKVHMKLSPKAIQCGMTYQFQLTPYTHGMPNQPTFMNPHISRTWPWILLEPMEWRMLTACWTLVTVLQQITFHLLEASIKTVLLQSISLSVGLIARTSTLMAAVVAMMKWWQGEPLPISALLTSSWMGKWAQRPFMFLQERNSLCLMQQW